MPYKLTPELADSLIALSADERYQHFLEKAADWEEIWGVNDDQGWLVQATEDNRHYITLWPHPYLVEDAIRRHLPGNRAEEIDFVFLLEQWLPLLIKEDILISVFPDRQWRGILVTAEQFQADLNQAIKNLTS